MENTDPNQMEQSSKSKKKMATWVKGLIAIVLVAVIGGGVYFGVQGGLFQGRLFRFFKTVESPKVPEVKDTEGVKMDSKTSIEMPSVQIPAVNPLLVTMVETLPGYTAYSSNGDLYGQFDVTNFYNTNSTGSPIYLLVFKVEAIAGSGVYDLEEISFEYTDANGGTGSQVCFGEGTIGDDLVKLIFDQNGNYSNKNLAAEDSNDDRVFDQNGEINSVYTEIRAGETQYFAIKGHGFGSCISGETKVTITNITFTDSDGITVSPVVAGTDFDRTIYWQ